MNINSTVKLFFIILGSCATVLAINGIIGHISFDRSFMGYLNDQGVQRMREIVPRIEEAYKKHNSWEFVFKNNWVWFELMRPDNISTLDMPPASAPPISDQTGAVPRMALLDAQGNYLIGNPAVKADAIKIPVVVNEKTVGWLAMNPFQKALEANSERFYQSQIRAWSLNALASVIVATLLALGLAHIVTKRIKNLMNAIHRLAAGDYTHRAQVNRKDEFSLLAVDINHLANTLEKAESDRNSFMADISHELRTPLSIMKAEIEAMQDGIRPINIASLKVLDEEVLQLGKLINDFHEIAVTQSGSFSFQFTNIDLTTFLQNTLESLNSSANEARLALNYHSLDQTILIKGDERRLHQLFSNLLSNSIRYTDSGGLISVNLKSISPSECIITIEDSPPGVRPEFIDRLFDRFFRVEGSRNRNSGGSGLGLTICRNIVDAHKGSIHASTSELGGLCITIKFPIETKS